MARYVWIGFAFLAFAFYQASGGANFDSDALREARLAERMSETTALAEAPDLKSTEQKIATEAAIAPEEPVTRLSLDLAKIDDILGQQQSDLTIVPEAVSLDETLNETDEAPQITASGNETAPSPAIVLPSLILDAALATDPVADIPAADADQPPLTALTDFSDMRAVSASRINVRGGPGTDFDIVGTLDSGALVLVLEDPGTGWVRARADQGDLEGWIADFLLTEG